VLAVACAWALHAGIDWIWEQPAVGVPVLAMVGAVVARSPGDAGASRRSRPAAGAARSALIAACILCALVTGWLAVASADLEASLRAARRGHCEAARERARQSAHLRPTSDTELVLASCALRRDPRAALESVDRALARDPLDWRVHYDRALVLATLGRDPRPEAGAAHGLNLREQTATVALTRFATDAPAVWRSEAARTPFLLP
jgi:Flp pilus assembly protein TadD